jgi:ectoine hydroxylase-related dioxygenase (phytanoyl-CoA dioxygenase family)
MDSIRGVLTEEQRGLFRPVAVELKAGEASFHHPRTVHGSYANDTPRPRRATVLNVFRDGVRSNSDSAPLEGVPPVPKGEPMGGRFFPLLFDPAAEGVAV